MPMKQLRSRGYDVVADTQQDESVPGLGYTVVLGRDDEVPDVSAVKETLMDDRVDSVVMGATASVQWALFSIQRI